MLGAAIGPGASSHWLALDWLAPAWDLGVFASWIRWDNAALFNEEVPAPKREDVSLFWGIRGNVEVRGVRAGLELQTGVRMDYLFQSFTPEPPSFEREGVDIPNHTLAIVLSRAVGG